MSINIKVKVLIEITSNNLILSDTPVWDLMALKAASTGPVPSRKEKN